MNPRIRAILFDLEGTLHFKGALLPGALEALHAASSAGMQRRFLTNSDSKTAEQMAAELATMGLEVPPHEVFTAATAGLTFLRQQHDNRCFALLPAALQPAFSSFVPRSGRVDYVVVGDVRESATYESLNQAFRHLRSGARLLALQKGRYFVRSDGEHLDTGGFVELLAYASGKEAILLGKPSATFFELALRDLGSTPGETLVVGDDVSTDIAGAHAIGARSVLMRTGKYDGNRPPGSSGASEELSSLADLPRLLERLL